MNRATVSMLGLVLASLLLACPSTQRQPAEPTAQQVTEVPVPKNVFAPAGTAVAY